MVRFFKQVAPMTPALQEFVAREPSHAVAIVPGRMVDAAEDMLTLWQRNEPNAGPSKPHKMPVALVAVARDVNPTQVGRNKEISSPVHVIIPGDDQQRVFELRTQARDYRVQVLFAAHDSDTAESLASQFVLWLGNWRNHVFEVNWKFAGIDSFWPAQLDTADVLPNLIQTDVKSLTMMAVDVSFCTTQPIYRGVGAGETYLAADGTLQVLPAAGAGGGVGVGVGGGGAPGTGVAKPATGYEGNLPGKSAQVEGFPFLRQVDGTQQAQDSGADISKREVTDAGVKSV